MPPYHVVAIDSPARGATTVECAIVVPFILLLVLAIFQASLLFLKFIALSEGLAAAGRSVVTGLDDCETKARQAFADAIRPFVNPEHITEFQARQIVLWNGVAAVRFTAAVDVPCLACIWNLSRGGAAVRFSESAIFSVEDPQSCAFVTPQGRRA